jgi:hypothetical protein
MFISSYAHLTIVPPLTHDGFEAKQKTRLARFSKCDFLLASSETRLPCHPSSRDHPCRQVPRFPSHRKPLHLHRHITFDLVNPIVLINNTVLRLNCETILVLLVLSMCRCGSTLTLPGLSIIRNQVPAWSRPSHR